MTKYISLREVPQLTRISNYSVHCPWSALEEWISRRENNVNEIEGYKFELNPEFQRNHVWTRKQQIAYVEYIVRGGMSGRDIYFNHPEWQGTYIGTMVLVDGKQRLEAVRAFLRGDFPILDNQYITDFNGDIPDRLYFIIHVNDLQTEKEVLTWYLEMNSGGTPHTEEELNKVVNMLNNL